MLQAQALQARSAYGAERRIRIAPQDNTQQEARGTSEARVTSAHPQGQVTGVLMRAAGRQRAFLDVNQSLGRVKRSDLVQSGRNTSPDVVGAL